MMDQVARVHAHRPAARGPVRPRRHDWPGRPSSLREGPSPRDHPAHRYHHHESSTATPGAARRSPPPPSPGQPIKFAGMGEKLADLEPFHPDRIASPHLGMGGRPSTLIEKAEGRRFPRRKRKKQAPQDPRRCLSRSRTFLSQMQQVRKNGRQSARPRQDGCRGLPGHGPPLPDLSIEDKEHGEARGHHPVDDPPASATIPPHHLGRPPRPDRPGVGGLRSREVKPKLLKQFEAVRKMIEVDDEGVVARRGPPRRPSSLPPGLGL